MFSSRFMLFPTFKNKKIKNWCEKNNSGGGGGGVEIFFLEEFRKTIVDRDNGNLYPIYIEKQQLWC